MKLWFTRPRMPRSLDGLTPIDQDQMVACARAYDGSTRTAAECLPDDDDEEAGLYGLEAWDVANEAGEVVYNLWVYAVDTGSIFKAGTTEDVGGFIQSYLECDDDALAAALAAAHAAHADWPEKSCLMIMAFGDDA